MGVFFKKKLSILILLSVYFYFFHFHSHSHFYLTMKWKQIIILTLHSHIHPNKKLESSIHSYAWRNRNGNKIFILVPHLPNMALKSISLLYFVTMSHFKPLRKKSKNFSNYIRFKNFLFEYWNLS